MKISIKETQSGGYQSIFAQRQQGKEEGSDHANENDSDDNSDFNYDSNFFCRR